MERIFECQSEEIISSLELEGNWTLDDVAGSIAGGDKTSSVEKSWSDFIDSKIFLDSALLEVPPDNFYNLIGFVFDFDLVESIAGPVVTLGDIPGVEIVLDIVLMPEIVGRIDIRSSSHAYLNKNYIKYSTSAYN